MRRRSIPIFVEAGPHFVARIPRDHVPGGGGLAASGATRDAAVAAVKRLARPLFPGVSLRFSAQDRWFQRRVRQLPKGAVCTTNAVLTSGNRIKEGWQAGGKYFETYHYPGALNFSEIEELDMKPDWAR